MKVSIPTFLPQVFRAKAGSSTEKEGDTPTYQQQQKNGEEQKRDRKPPTEEEVQKALSHFAEDPHVQHQGLKAILKQGSPGGDIQWTITIETQDGTQIRQMTGTEFVLLRSKTEAPADDPHKKVGSLLDQEI